MREWVLIIYFFHIYRGYGFVKFSDENEQKKALEEFQNASGLGGKPIRISIAVNKGYISFKF